MDTSQKRARERRKLEKRQEKEARRREREEAKLHPLADRAPGAVEPENEDAPLAAAGDPRQPAHRREAEERA